MLNILFLYPNIDLQFFMDYNFSRRLQKIQQKRQYFYGNYGVERFLTKGVAKVKHLQQKEII